MPHRSVVFSIPPNTTKDSPYEETITLEGIVLTYVRVLIPSAHRGKVGFAIEYGEERILPSKQGEWICGDDESISFYLGWKLPEERTTLKLVGYNEWDTYNHAFYIRFEIEDRTTWSPLSSLVNLFKRLLFLFGGG